MPGLSGQLSSSRINSANRIFSSSHGLFIVPPESSFVRKQGERRVLDYGTLTRLSEAGQTLCPIILVMRLIAAALVALLPCLAASLENVEKAKAIGNPAAPVRIEVYSDF